MRILVTGGTGYLGRAVVTRLLARGHDVTLFGRTAALVAAGMSDSTPHLIPAVGDITDDAAVEAAARGCDAIIHMAALVAVWHRDRRRFDAVNISGLRHILRAARVHHIARIVYTSSFLGQAREHLPVIPDWNDYQRTKAVSADIARDALHRGAPLVCLYPGVIYGPGSMTDGNLVGGQIRDHLAGRLPGLVGADKIWSFVYVHDVADAHVAAVEQTDLRGAFELGGENAPQIRPFEIIRQRTGVALPRRLPGWLVAAGAASAEAWAGLTRRTPLITTGTLEILLRDWPLPSDHARDTFGFRVTPLETGVRAILSSLSATTPGVELS